MSKPKSDTQISEHEFATDLDGCEPGYDAWVRAKIEAAVREADIYPERRIPLDQVWKKFGLER